MDQGLRAVYSVQSPAILCIQTMPMKAMKKAAAAAPAAPAKKAMKAKKRAAAMKGK